MQVGVLNFGFRIFDFEYAEFGEALGSENFKARDNRRKMIERRGEVSHSKRNPS